MWFLIKHLVSLLRKQERGEGRKEMGKRKKDNDQGKRRIMNRHGHDESDLLLIVRLQSSHSLLDCLQLSHAFTLGHELFT